MLLVDLATNRGRGLWDVAPMAVVVDNVAALVSFDSHGRLKRKIPFSVGFGETAVPVALGTENLAKETGLNVACFFVELVRVFLLSARLASDSEPP